MLILLLFSFIIISIVVLLYKLHNKRIISILKETILAQVVIWLIFIAMDFCDENDIGIPIITYSLFFSIIFIPVIISILYIKSDKEETEKIKRFIITSIIWIIETSIIGLYIWNLVNFNNWFIVQQRSGGIFDWNGIEYFLFPYSCAIIPIIIVLSCKVINYIYKKIKSVIKK